ncbi:MAG: response regulator [Nannocystis sp.]|nr:response regulator [Nannocystis sp.]
MDAPQRRRPRHPLRGAAGADARRRPQPRARERHRHHRAHAQPGRAGHRQGGRRGREPGQERLPGQHEPRDPHADERDHRHDQPVVGHPAGPRPARLRRDPAQLLRLAAHPDQRHPRLLQDRGQQARAGERRLRAAGLRRVGDRPRRRQQARHQGPEPRRDHRPERPAAAHLRLHPPAPDPHQPARQRRQVHPHGEITITVSARQLTEGHGDTPSRYELQFAVKDTGIGIRPDRMDRLFQSFSQVDNSTTRKYGGTGLGLAISKRLAEMLGGTMWAESVVDQGSTFYFTILAAADHTPSEPEFSATPLFGRRVLIVDASDTQRQLLAAHVRTWGMIPILCSAAADALNYLRSGLRDGHGGNIDVALVDSLLPEEGDLRVLHELHRRTTPAVLLTPLGRRHLGESQRQRATVVTKPIKASQLYETLLQLLVGRRPPETHEPSVRSEFDPGMGERLPLRILAVEDNATNQKLILLMLERLGYRADSAYHGLEALEALARHTYDVVLMDVQMPEMDGLEATRRIRQQPGSQPRIIAMTANAMDSDRQACLAAGMDDYVSKPIQVRELRLALERCTRNPASATAPVSGLHARDQLDPGLVATPAELAADAEAGFTQLRDLLGREVALEIAALFLSEAATTITSLAEAVANARPDQLREAAHSLKGSAGGMHLHHLHQLASALELRGRNGTLDGAAALLAELQRQFLAVQQAFELQLNVNA